MRRIIPITSLYCIAYQSKSYSDTYLYHCDETKNHFKSELIFLGTGSSSGTPYIYDLMFDDTIPFDERDKIGVLTSKKANNGDPRTNKDYRCNPSIIVRYRDNINSNNHTNILFDCGKTFRESAIRWFPYHNIKSIDSVILTHGHADAIFGIDDLRMTQSRGAIYPLDIYQSSGCKKVTKQVFSYLYPPKVNSLVCTCDINNEVNDDDEINSFKIEKVSSPVQRFVANINWIDIIPFKKFQLKNNFDILPIPVIHGDDCLCMGFIFGRKEKVLYLSDLSQIPKETLKEIKKINQFDLLIIDSLHPTKAHPTHISMKEAIEIARDLKPKKTLLIGMCQAFKSHDEENKNLKKLLETDNLDIQLAYDGQKLELDL